jgi:uncharacterized spore protein YtfJ
MTDSSALDKLGAIRDAMGVSRVFGESYHINGVTIVPVATTRGGGGGGAGTGTGKISGEKGTGPGLGVGAAVRPVGVVVIKDGKVHLATDRRRDADNPRCSATFLGGDTGVPGSPPAALTA